MNDNLIILLSKCSFGINLYYTWSLRRFISQIPKIKIIKIQSWEILLANIRQNQFFFLNFRYVSNLANLKLLVCVSFDVQSLPYNFLLDDTYSTGQGNLADLVPADMHMRKEFRRYAGQKKTHTTRSSSEFSKHEVSALFITESIFLSSRAEGTRRACTRRSMYALCILSRSETERTPERESVPERALVRDWSISYLPIKGRRFVQFILNHGTVTGCQ